MRHHRLLERVSRVLLLGLSLYVAGGIGSGRVWAQETNQDPNLAAEAPQTAPPGWSQADWNKQLEICKEVSAEVVRRQSLPVDQLAGLPNISSEIHNCERMSAPVENQYQPTGPTSVDPIPAVPVASPTPPSNLTSGPSAAAVSSLSNQSKGIPVRQSPTGLRIPLKLNPPPPPEPAASDSLLDLSAPSQSNPSTSSFSQSDLAVADSAPALSLPGTLGPIAGSATSGADANACTQGMPPNIAADVNSIQSVEFTNSTLSVWNKEPNYQLALATGSFTNPETQYQFWCLSKGANGNFLPLCESNLPPTLSFGDADIVYDSASGQWFVGAVPELSGVPQPYIFFAASTGTNATDQPENWNRWSIDNTTYQSQFSNGLICPTAPYTSLDQPLIGFSDSYIAIDTTCHNPANLNQAGTDTAILIPIQEIKEAPSQPDVIQLSTTLPFRSTPSRDRTATGYDGDSIWFLSTSIQGAPNPGPPVVTWNVANSDGQIGSTGSVTLTGPGEAVGNYDLPNVIQPNCPANYNCTIRGNDARIRAVDLQVRPTDNTAYLASAFTYAAASGGYVLNWFVQPAANPQAIVTYLESYNDGTLLDFATLSLDPDLDGFMTATDLSPVANPAVQWYQPRFYMDNNQVVGLGEGYLQSSGSYAFTGESSPTIVPNYCGPTSTLQRWGDFNSAGWDYTVASPNGKPGVFWAAVEYTNGTSYPANPDQSSEWWNISDPLPYYVATADDTKNCTSGSACKLTITVPSGTQAGDVLLANIGIGELASKTLTLPSSSWTLLPFSNLSGATQVTSSVPCGIEDTGWMAAHVYAVGDASKFTFSEPAKNYKACGGTVGPVGMGGTLTAYRDAGQSVSTYGLSGYGTTVSENQYTFGPTSAPTPANNAPPEGTMMTQLILTGTGGTGITSFTGVPPLNLESSLAIFDAPFYDDQMSFGPYTSTSNCTPSSSEYCGFVNMALGIPSY